MNSFSFAARNSYLASLKRATAQQKSWRTRRCAHKAVPLHQTNGCVPRRCVSSFLRPVTAADENVFRSFGSTVLTGGEDTSAFVTDWTKHWKAPGAVTVVIPSTVDQVAQILKYCSSERIGVVPVSGNTGLVGGSVPMQAEIVLSTNKLNKVHSLDAATGVLQCQAGCILQNLQDYASASNLMVPIDLGSRGTCCIGGNVATNAGGQYYYRYGSIAANLLGLQVVTATGNILNLNYGESSCNLKDNTGYKLHQLFVGSEGTLGVITGVALWCRPALHSRHTALLACDSFDDILRTLQTAKQCLGETLAAMEWMDGASVNLVGTTYKHPIPILRDDNSCYPHYLLVETHGVSEEHDQAKMEGFLEAVTNNNTVANGVLAQDLQQSQHFWKLRESANPAAAATGYTYKYDVSLPGSNFSEFIDKMRDRLAPHAAVNTNWGHVLDGNLHFNVTDIGTHKVDEVILETLEPYIFEAVLRRGGSISAEHGLGQAKNRHMNRIHDPATLATMRALKGVFDPVGILNPGKVLPPSS
jgi:D-2-hydroxyglutarate dehydrogenase